MLSQKITLIISISLILVVAFNVAIYFSVKRNKKDSPYQMLGKVVKRARNPWEIENQNLSELSKQVAELKAKHPPDSQDEQNEK